MPLFLTMQDKSAVQRNEQKAFSINGQNSGNFLYNTVHYKLSFMLKETFLLFVRCLYGKHSKEAFFFHLRKDNVYVTRLKKKSWISYVVCLKKWNFATR